MLVLGLGMSEESPFHFREVSLADALRGVGDLLVHGDWGQVRLEAPITIDRENSETTLVVFDSDLDISWGHQSCRDALCQPGGRPISRLEGDPYLAT
eukprot:1495715-Rhodomonas_salina.1